MAADGDYVNVRDFLGPLIGTRVVDVTQHDADEFPERGAFVCLLFDNGWSITVPIGDAGFSFTTPEAD